MSQSATLYRISKHNFKTLKSSEDVSLLSVESAYVTFMSTHEGLRYILSKQRSEEEVRLIDKIFYPEAFFERNPEDESDYPSEMAILYHLPIRVQQVLNILKSIDHNQFELLFDAAEMNEKKIYPWFWTKDKSSQQGISLYQLSEDFLKLKDFFAQASEEQQYVLSFVG